MYNPKRSLHYKGIFFAGIISIAFLGDIIFGTLRFPVLTLLVCGIVIVYEFVSPFIYASR